MGFWDTLTKGKADAMAAVKRLKDNDIAAAAMAAAAAVAMADGKLDPEEKAKVAGHIVRNEYLKQYEQAKLIAMFEEHVSNIEFDSRTGISGALKVVGKLAGSPEKAEAALMITISIADAEGGIGDDEKVVLRKVADALNLSLSNYDL
jgi:tellurite resistance protein TerB